MLETLKNAWRVKEIRKKIIFTLFVILVFRLGSVIPVPFIDAARLSEELQNSMAGGNTFFSYLGVFTGGAMEYGALFAMSVTPYINASIIMQLLTVAIPALERISKEEDGQKRIAKYTRFATVILGLIQGGAYYWWLYQSDLLTPLRVAEAGSVGQNIFVAAVVILCFTAGSAMMMWLGEKIDEKGVGNGISILLFAGIISQLPSGITALLGYLENDQYWQVITTIVVLTATVVFVVWMHFAERRIPIQYAKRVVGRKQYGGQNTHMPIKVNMGGVMPIIFASSILSIPSTILAFMDGTNPSRTYQILSLMSYQSWTYALVYLAMIIAFAYFYTTIQYNPVEMANNLRKNSGAIPGIRPGKPTQDFMHKILNRITLIGAIFLGAIAVLPIILGQVGDINITLGGTSLLIVVGVAIDTVQQLESQLMMRHYKGFLD